MCVCGHGKEAEQVGFFSFQVLLLNSCFVTHFRFAVQVGSKGKIGGSLGFFLDRSKARPSFASAHSIKKIEKYFC